MKIAAFSMLAYGLLLIFGGFMGYRAGSRASLIAGGSFGALAIVVFVLSLLKWPPASLCGIILSVVVMIAMARRAVTKGLVGPAGITIFISVVVVVLQIIVLASAKT
jgi:uncharacterized membrane protein (UPF0136 family)